MERQINEYEYKKTHGTVEEDKVVIPLEKTIQYYVGYWINKYASLAKSGKAGLFDKNKIEELLRGISDERVIEAMACYNEIAKVLTMYRKTRRNEHKDEFSRYIGVEQEWLLENIQDFLFMNTGDILILNTVQNLKGRYNQLALEERSVDKLIADAVFVIKDVIKSEQGVNISGLTKSASVFAKVQERVSKLTAIVTL